MVKHAQTIRWQKPTNCLSVFDHFVGLALKGLNVLDTVFFNVNRCILLRKYYLESENEMLEF